LVGHMKLKLGMNTQHGILFYLNYCKLIKYNE